jgi:hypothetical protein
LPLDEYAARRAEHFEAHRDYCEQLRRVRLGPNIVLTFENRQTLWYRVQELLRVLRLRDAALVQAELDRANRLLPRRHQLVASAAHPAGNVSACLMLDSIRVAGRILPASPEDQALGITSWIEFGLIAMDRSLFADLDVATWIEIDIGTERHSSGPTAAGHCRKCSGKA